MKLFWTGTDSLMLNDLSKRRLLKKPYWWAFRLFTKIADRLFIESHFCDSEGIMDNLHKFGMKSKTELFVPPIKYDKPLGKVKHEGFNILYYFPKGGDTEFLRWIYGFDIFTKLVDRFPDVNFIVVKGDSDMGKIYPITDFCIRPNRHDGNARMIRECEIQGIPYYWSATNPDYEAIVKSIKKEKDEKG